MPTFDITSIPTTYIVQNPTYQYYSNNVKFTNVTTNGKTYLNLTANGTPFPAKCGNNPTDTTNGGFTNDGTTAIVWLGNPFYLVDQKYNFFITYRGGTNDENPQKMEMGIQGMFANGVALYNPSSGTSVPLLDGLKYRKTDKDQPHDFCAVFFEDFYSIDSAGGHCSPNGISDSLGNRGQYHYHDDGFLMTHEAWNNTKFLERNSYYNGSYIQDIDNTTNPSVTYNNYIRYLDGHSKIVGICFDGYPIYGPYGYINPQNKYSGVTQMTSSYVLKTQEFDGRPYLYTDTFSYSNPLDHTPLSIIISAGAYMDDYMYSSGQGSLDQYNGRYCVTPEYPNGTYAYFTTSTFPFIIGNFSKNKRNTSIDTNTISTDIATNNKSTNKSTNINYFTMKSVFSNNSQIYYKPGSLSSGITSVRNARHKSKNT